MSIEFDQLQPVGAAGHDGDRRLRRRIVAGVAATMLIAAAAGAGYGIGRNVDGESSTASSTGSTRDSDEAATTPTTRVPARPVATDLAVGESGDDSSVASDRGVVTGDGGPIQASGSMGYPAFGTQPLETLYDRVTDSGFSLRVQLGQLWDQGFEGDWGAGDWRPAPWCFESGQLRVSMAGNGIVDVGSVPWYSEPFKGRAISSLLLGGNEGAPQWVVVVQVPADVTTVRIDFADGTIDEATPQNGIAVLTGPGQPSEPVTEGGYTYWIEPTPQFDVLFSGGGEPVVIPADGIANWDDPEFRESCTPPPPALPDAGEQPADPAAADAEIRAAMSSLYGAVGTGDDQSGLIDDPTGIAEAREQVEAGGYADDAAGASATIDELVFTTPSEAWFRYSIDTPGNDFDRRYGIAVLVDGTWKITRDTICQDLSLAGGDCGGDWRPVFPPGAYPEEVQYLDDEYSTRDPAAPATTVLEGD